MFVTLPLAPPDLGSRSSHTPAEQLCRPFSLERGREGDETICTLYMYTMDVCKGSSHIYNRLYIQSVRGTSRHLHRMSSSKQMLRKEYRKCYLLLFILQVRLL